MTWFTGVVLEDNAVHSLPSYVCKPAPHLQQTKAVVAFSLIFWDLNMMKAQPWSFSWTGHDHLCASLALNCGTTFPDGHILCVLCSGIHYPTCFVTTRLSMSFHSHFPSSKFLGHVVGGPAQGPPFPLPSSSHTSTTCTGRDPSCFRSSAKTLHKVGERPQSVLVCKFLGQATVFVLSQVSHI